MIYFNYDKIDDNISYSIIKWLVNYVKKKIILYILIIFYNIVFITSQVLDIMYEQCICHT
jgi:hypothetical protein